MCLRVYVCARLFMREYAYLCVSTKVSVCVCMYDACEHAYEHVRTHACVVCMNVCVYVCAYAGRHAGMNDACVYACVQVCTQRLCVMCPCL